MMMMVVVAGGRQVADMYESLLCWTMFAGVLLVMAKESRIEHEYKRRRKNATFFLRKLFMNLIVFEQLVSDLDRKEGREKLTVSTSSKLSSFRACLLDIYI